MLPSVAWTKYLKILFHLHSDTLSWQVSVAQNPIAVNNSQFPHPSQKEVDAKGLHISAVPTIKEKPANPVIEAITGESTS